MNDLQANNLREIEGLNQRGGRTLSFVDLISVGTMSTEMVAYCWAAVAGGSSFLTAARPGGAGKSTILANLLVLLPPGEEIVTFSDPTVVQADALRCSLAHEIGSGRYYGYIWGGEVRRFVQQGCRLAGCLHADTLPEVEEELQGAPLGLSAAETRQFGLVLFIHSVEGQRRVVAVHEATEERFQQVFWWDGQEFARTGGRFEVEMAERLEAVERIVAEGEAAFGVVREKVLGAYLTE